MRGGKRGDKREGEERRPGAEDLPEEERVSPSESVGWRWGREEEVKPPMDYTKLLNLSWNTNPMLMAYVKV